MPPPLTPELSFVVQLREAPGRARWSGRVEHVVSGRSAPFESLSELTRFVRGTLRERDPAVEPEPPEAARRSSGDRAPRSGRRGRDDA